MRTLITIGVFAIGLAACAPVDNTADPNITPEGAGTVTAKTAKPKSDLRTVTYRIGGSARAGSITYSTASGMEQQNDARIPWKKTFSVKRGEFTALDVSVQNAGSGTVSCEIDVDGVKVKAARSSGEFAIASCDHALGF